MRLEDPSITPEEYNQKTAGWLHERAVGHVRTSMREMTEAEITEEVRMLQSRAWPYAVVCAVKNPFKKEGSPLARTGVIFKDRVSRQTVPHVFKIGVFDWLDLMKASGQGRPMPTPEWLREQHIECLEFSTVEAMVQDGWIGD